MARKFSGQRFRDARIAAKISREQLAISIGRTAQTVFVYERERVTPPISVLLQIIDVLGCNFDDLLEEDRVAA